VVLSGIPQLLKGLERLGLPSATDRVLVKLGRFCTKLKEIHFEVRDYLFSSLGKLITTLLYVYGYDFFSIHANFC
jgi:DNA-binding ferritin-like protein